MVDEKVRARQLWREQRRGRIRPSGEAESLRQGWIQLLTHLGINEENTVLPALFSSTATEPDMRGIWSEHSRFLLPYLVGDDGQVLSDPMWSIYEAGAQLSQPDLKWPAQVAGTPLYPEALRRADVIAVPALAIDASGTRLGQGGGWYDRALMFRRPDAAIIGIIDSQAFVPAGHLPRESHDIPVDAVLTPKGFTVLGEPPYRGN
ncbi:MAG: 5-formyltetrahydrofolate cyclo-ligase [Actinomycetaceae bacterium]|nr:5-formyltetrahydrofolate cyclo-ligase [Actinomycetaceae bacterium]